MKLVFDIGCNKGEFTEKCLEKYENVEVVAVDANPNFISLYENKERVTFLNRLVAEEDEEYMDFYIEPRQDGVSTASKKFMQTSRFVHGSKNLPPNSAAWTAPIKVETISLDTLIKQHGNPDFIKIDVEGYEYEVLSSLQTKQQAICFEWHEESAEEMIRCAEHLHSLGYEEFGVIGYFDEGDIFEKVTYDDRADPYMTFPENYYPWEELATELLENVCQPKRRVNYGMFFVR